MDPQGTAGRGPRRVLAADPFKVAATRIMIGIASAVRSRGSATVAFSGGPTAGALHDALARMRVDWDRVDVLQVDERVAPDGDPARNAVDLLDRLVGPAGIGRDRVHLMPVGDGDADDAARAYAATLEGLTGAEGVIDVVHLGLGDDGHTASLFAQDPALDVMDVSVAATGEYRGCRRVTLTLPVINRAASLVWLVPAGGDNDALRRLLAGDQSIPGGRVSPDNAAVVTDWDDPR